MFGYEDYFHARLQDLREEGNYREFAHMSRRLGQHPQALFHNGSDARNVTVWCSNDYLGMGQHPKVIEAVEAALKSEGAGAGGTRNISGTNQLHSQLETALAAWHKKQAALIFTSGYVANLTALSTLGAKIPNMTILSDSKNHNSMIEGMRLSKCNRLIFNHNDMADLEAKLKSLPAGAPKIIAFESVYSMDGDIGNIKDICALARRYGAFTYLDEVHAVGMYGATGAGITQSLGLEDEIDLIQGTLGKACGLIGGYIAGSDRLIDFIRSFGQGFIFTTALPPMIAAGLLTSISILQSEEGTALRAAQQQKAADLKARLQAGHFPVMETPTHIVPLMIGDPEKTKAASKLLLNQHNIYVQPINHPTVEKGTERLRFTPAPAHSEQNFNDLIDALGSVWAGLGLSYNK